MEIQCFGQAISFTIEADRLGRSHLRAVSKNGAPVTNQSTGRMASLLTELGGANLGSARCVSETAVAIAISGSRYNTPLGEEDDIIEWLMISLANEDQP